MPDVRVSISLPFALLLTEGDFQTGAVGEVIRVSAGPLEETGLQTLISATFPHPDIEDPDAIQTLRVEDADRLLPRTKRLLRWYRSVRRRADINELTRAQASPFRYEIDGAERNDIIHRGFNATEDEAQLALRVARRIVEIMNDIPIPAPPTGN
jgi:hypothetical protein